MGRTEEILGRWLRGRRHDVIVATKGFGATGPHPSDQGLSRKHLLDAIDASLQRPVITSPIVGASRPEQLDDVVAAAGKTLDAGLKARLDELTAEYRLGDDIR